MTDQLIVKYQKSLNVLILEDNPVDLTVLKSMLTESTEDCATLSISNTLDAALDKLKNHPIDVAIVDLNLPDSQGLNTLHIIHQCFPELTIVVNTGAYEEDLGLATLSKGAQDFLVKGKYSAYTLNKVLRFAIERKRLELELTKAAQTIKDTQEQLVQAEKMKVVGLLASGIAHEVRNPLATILYGITYLQEHVKVENENYPTILKNVKEATHRANVIISDLLDFSKANKLHLGRVNLHALIDRALSLVQHELERNGITLHREFDNNLPDLYIDQNRIEQVIVNLLLNAIYATERGTIKIKTSQKILSEKDLKEIPDPSCNHFRAKQKVIYCEIEDTGWGIPEQDMKQIFYPFFTSRRAKGGVGLGLFVARNIIDIHHGALFLENKDQGGVCAIIVLGNLEPPREKEDA